MRLTGTSYFPDLRDKILVIEDINERLHKIDLMLQQLKQQSTFSGLKGIIFGQFTNCNGDEEDGTLIDIFNDFLQETSLPAVYDFNFGHTVSRRILPIGGKAQFTADTAELNIRLD